MRVMLPQESGGGFLTIKYEDNDTMDMVMAKVLQHTNSKRVGRRSSLVFTKEDFELSSSPSAPAAGSAIPSNQSTLYLRYTSDNEMCKFECVFFFFYCALSIFYVRVLYICACVVWMCVCVCF